MKLVQLRKAQVKGLDSLTIKTCAGVFKGKVTGKEALQVETSRTQHPAVKTGAAAIATFT